VIALPRWPLSVRHDLGGRWFLDPVALVVVVPTATVASVITYARPTLWSVLGWTLANLLAFALCAVLGVALALATRSRRRDAPLPIVVTLVAAASLGALKVLATDRAGALLGLVSAGDATLAGRVVQGTVLGVVVIPVLVLMRATLARYRTEHRLLVAETFAEVLDPGTVEASGEAARQEAAAVLGELRVVLADAAPSVAAAMLVDAVENRLRPLTHRLWEGAPAPSSDLTVRGLIGAMVRRPLYPVLVPATVHGVIVGLFALDLTDAGRALTVGSLSAAVLAGILHLARVSRPRGGRAAVGLAHVGLTLVAVSTSATLILSVLVGPALTLPIPALVLLMLAWIIPLVLTSGVVATATHDRDAVRVHLVGLLGPDWYSQLSRAHVDASAARDVADRLHGDLQGSLLAAGERLRALRSDSVAAGVELDRIDALLAGATGNRATVAAVPLAEQLAEFAARWQGFIDVRWSLDPALDIGSRTVTLLAGIVSEAITNAYRHGDARNVRVDLASEDGATVLRVEDDGIGPRGGREGIGSRHLDVVAPGAWSRTVVGDGGTRLEVVLAAPHAARPAVPPAVPGVAGGAPGSDADGSAWTTA